MYSTLATASHVAADVRRTLLLLGCLLALLAAVCGCWSCCLRAYCWLLRARLLAYGWDDWGFDIWVEFHDGVSRGLVE